MAASAHENLWRNMALAAYHGLAGVTREIANGALFIDVWRMWQSSPYLACNAA